jgi:hypothetical protein
VSSAPALTADAPICGAKSGTAVVAAGSSVAKTHLLQCRNEGCAYATAVVAGDLPTICRGCKREGNWLIEQVYIWTLQDLKFLRQLRIAPE